MEYIIIGLLAAIVVLQIILLTVLVLRTKKKKQDPKEPAAVLLIQQNIAELRRENQLSMQNISKELYTSSERSVRNHVEMMQSLNRGLNEMREANSVSADRQSRRMESSLRMMQESNEKKLEEMRQTVDEKLTETLTSRLNSSFKTG